MLRIIILTTSIFVSTVIKAQENNLQLIFLENNQFTFSKPYVAKDYYLMRKKKVNYIKIVYSDSNQTIPLNKNNIWGLVWNNTSKGIIDTFLIDKGFFSLPRRYKLIAGEIDNNAIFYREQSIFVLYGYISFDKYYLSENKKVIHAKSKKYLADNIANKNVSKKLLSSKRSIEWLLQRDKELNEVRLLSLYKN